jgi:DNA-binding NtrC family response regulator/tetratricopeptide (TPR) repeat protein
VGDEVTLLEQLAEFSRSAGEYGSAMEYYEQILRLAEKARESPDLVGDVYFKMAVCRSQTGDYAAALALLDRAEAHSRNAPALVRCRIQNERAYALLCLGEYEKAEQCVQRVTEAILDRPAAAELARAQKSHGILAMRRGDWDAATRAFEAALAGFRLLEDRAGIAQCLNNLGLMAKNLGNLDRAADHLRAAVGHHEALGDTLSVGQSLHNLGLVEFKAGRWEAARGHMDRALRLLEGLGNQWGVGLLCLSLGNYHRCRREWTEAQELYDRAAAIVDGLGEARERVLVKEFRGDLAFASEAFDEARRLYAEALAGGEELAPRGDLVLETARRLADLESTVGRREEARRWLERGLTLSESLGEGYERGHLLRVRARLEAADGDMASASQSYRDAMEIHTSCSVPYDAAVTQLEYAAFCIENIVELDAAGAHLERARETFERIGAEYEAGHAYLLAAKLEMVCDHPTGEARHHLQAAMDLLERVGSDEDQEELRAVHRDIDRLLEESALSERNDLAALNEAVGRVHAARDRAARVKALEQGLEERMNADRASLLLRDPVTGALAPAPESSLPAADAPSVLELVEALRGSAGFGAKPVVSTSPVRDPRFAGARIRGLERLGSVVFMPLFSESEWLGGLYVDLRAEAGYFRQPALDFLVAFAATATAAVQDMRLEAVRHENRQLRRRLSGRAGFSGIVTQNRRMLEILDLVERVAESRATVLLEGETGTGKELVARALHDASPRPEAPFVAVNCAALSRDVLESELFGHVKGSFTDAKRDKMGLFEKADGGTILLDEIDKTSREFQERLLRVVDLGEIKPVGSSQVRHIDVRIVCASNQPLKELVDAGRFLADLYYRLRVIRIEIPPLRERPEDIPLLVEHFVDHFRRTIPKDVRGFTPDAMARLVAYSWPGNVRDLRHEVERAVALADAGTEIDLGALSPDVHGAAPHPTLALSPQQSLQECVEAIEKDLVEQALRRTAGNRSHAARLLGLSRRGLLNKIARYAIDL